jgi:hypothetical protein
MRVRTRFILHIALLAIALAVCAGRVAAQSTLGTLVGNVTDASGAVVPGTTVTVTEAATKRSTTVVTDATGSYHVYNLEPGTVVAVFALQGFGQYEASVQILARQTVRVDVRLQPARAQEQVEVVASLTGIDLERATIDDSRSGADINRLALNFRATTATSPIVVATLAQGVQQDRNGSISVAGALPFMTSFSVDGLSTQNARLGGPNRELFPSVESIAEFKVSSASNNAEFMQVTDLTTTSKSGSNQFHGAGFWYYQDSALNSVDRFAPKDANGKVIKPKVTANSFGGTLGGPVLRNRTFFFATYDGARRPNQTTVSQLVPPDAFRAGDLSSVVRTLVNPFTRQPFVNNQIPINPSSAAILNSLYERQNQPTGASLSSPNFVINASGNFTVNGVDARVDHIFSPSHRVFGRFSYKDISRKGLDGGAVDFRSEVTTYNTKQGEPYADTASRQFAMAYNAVIGGSLLNEVRVGTAYNLDTTGYPLAAKGADLIRQFGFTGLPPAPPSGGLPSIEFADGTFIGTGGTKPREILSRSYQFNNNTTWSAGRHTVKGGIDVQRVEYKDQVTFFTGEDFGRYVFDGSFSGNAFADFLLGLPAGTGYAQNAPDIRPYSTHFAAYAQDDWRVSPKLTINYGLRYDLRPPMKDRTNQLGNFDRNYPGGRVIVSNAEELAQVPAALRANLPNTPFVTADQAGLPETLRFTDKNNINARLGVAWRPFSDNRTVVRGGFGSFTVPLYGQVNYSLAGVVTSDVPFFANSALPAGGFAIQFPNVFPAAQRVPGVNDFRRANQFDLRDPNVLQWSATVERELPAHFAVRVSYIGSRTKDLVWSPDLNQVPSNTLGYAAVRDTRPFRDWNVVTTRDNGPRARYHALGIEGNRRLARGFALRSSYTLARNYSDVGGAVPTSFPAENGVSTLDRFRGDADYGPVAFTRRHRSVTTFYWEIPVGAGRAFGGGMRGILNAVVGGWDATGLLLLQSGPYLTPSFSNADPSGTGANVRGFTSTQRPDCVGDGNLANPTAEKYFDVTAFRRPGNNIGRFGTCGVGVLHGPGTRTFSLTLGKTVPVVGKSRIRFEAAMSNLFDIENLDVPSSLAITSSAFGRVTRMQRVDQAGPRTVQLALRYEF